MSDHNLTPEQRKFPKAIRREAYDRLPLTCDHVRKILTEAQHRIMHECGIDPADEASIDAVMSQAFLSLRDEVTQPFRTEQMRLLSILTPQPIE